MIFIIHSTIIHDKIIWCKWAHDLVHFTTQNTSNHTMIWHKSFYLLKSSAWTPLMKSKIIRKIPHRLRLHTAWAPLMKSISIPFVSEAKSSPPSSMNHWLLFVEPAEWGAKGLEMGGEKAKNPARNGVGTASFSTKNKDICYKQMSFYASNICVMVANAVSNCYKRRCSGSLRCSSLIML